MLSFEQGPFITKGTRVLALVRVRALHYKGSILSPRRKGPLLQREHGFWLSWGQGPFITKGTRVCALPFQDFLKHNLVGLVNKSDFVQYTVSLRKSFG